MAKKGVIVKGTPSELDESGIGTRGVVAFVFKNENRDKDVVVRGFSFKTMLMAVCVNGFRHVEIQGCSLSEIDRNGLATVGAGGNITLMDNQIASRRSGMFVDWYNFSSPVYQTQGTQLRITGNTTTTVGNFKGSIGGIYVCRSSEGQIAGNTVSANAGYGIYINAMATPDSSASRLFISKNTIQGSDCGIRVSVGSGIQIENSKVSDSDYGLYLASSWNNRVIGNNLVDVVNSGVSILGSRCTQNQVIGNQIDIIGPPDGPRKSMPTASSRRGVRIWTRATPCPSRDQPRSLSALIRMAPVITRSSNAIPQRISSRRVLITFFRRHL